jgi:iron-sulfur cluster repair protein YtfE (RIC family)
MSVVESLKQDHAALRAKLDLIESALGLGPEAWYALRELCYSLGLKICDHIHCEDAVLADARRVLVPEIARRISLEHQDEPRQVNRLNRLFVHEPRPAFEAIEPTLRAMIRHLRRHLEEEEAEVFPAIARVPVHPTMTVNRVLREHPRTKAVFARWQIDPSWEGCDCLDEVAWRRCREGRTLAEQLQRAIEAPGDQSAAPSGQPAQACVDV